MCYSWSQSWSRRRLSIAFICLNDNKTANRFKLTRPSLVHTAAAAFLSQHDASRVGVIISLKEYRIDSLAMYRQASLFGRSFPALFMSSSRQNSLAGTQRCIDGHPSILYTPSITGARRVFAFPECTGSTVERIYFL